MAKIVFRFLEAIVKDDDVVPFINKVEELLKKFAGEAYHFRYFEEPLVKGGPTQTNDRTFSSKGSSIPNR